MKSVVPYLLVGILIPVSFLVFVMNPNVADATSKAKMECLSRGGHYSNGYCKEKNSSSNTPSSKQMKGDSEEYYYNKDHAIDLAQTEIMNKASEYCSSGYKSRIDWHDRNTTCTERNEQYRCQVYATTTCLSEPCGQRFCGSKR